MLVVYSSLHGWLFDVRVECSNTSVIHNEYAGFDLSHYGLKTCNGTEAYVFQESYGLSAALVSILSIASLIYCLAMLFLYLYRWNMYTSDDNLPRMDTAGTIIIASLWFIMFWTWWRQSSALEYYTSPENVQAINEAHKLCLKENSCKFTSYAMYAPLTVSVLGCLGCVILFSYNIWITYKETVWFRQRQMNQVPHTIETEPHTLA